MQPIVNQLPEELDHVQWWALIVSAIAWVICIIGWIATPRSFFTAYLYAFLFVLALSIGSMAIVMLHHLTGGNWGRPIRELLEAAMTLMPLVAILFIPILFGLGHLYPWAVPDVVERDHVLQEQRSYLNGGFFALRAVIYFIAWCALALFFSTASLRFQRTEDPVLSQRMRRWSAAGILIFALTMSLATVDWVMTRQAHWYSTVLGFIVMVGQTLTAMALAIIVLRTIVELDPLPEYVNSRVLVDLGNLLMTLVILWSYMSLAQFLVIWMGNTRVEATWYAARGVGPNRSGWRFVGISLIILHFFIPFVLLLFRYNKRHFNILTGIAALVLAMRVVDYFYLAVPTSLDQTGRVISWMTPFPVLALGGTWLFFFIGLLRRRPLVSRVEMEPEPITPHGHATPGIT